MPLNEPVLKSPLEAERIKSPYFLIWDYVWWAQLVAKIWLAPCLYLVPIFLRHGMSANLVPLSDKKLLFSCIQFSRLLGSLLPGSPMTLFAPPPPCCLGHCSSRTIISSPKSHGSSHLKRFLCEVIWLKLYSTSFPDYNIN